ncbi:hypothetical protein C6A85_76455, partial [Mycobacterium sp. ITM-2017-0098]
ASGHRISRKDITLDHRDGAIEVGQHPGSEQSAHARPQNDGTLLAYAMWALGHHPDIQDKVRAEVFGIGDRELTPEDVPDLGYTVQVLHEALRLCPPGAATARMTMQDVEVDGYRVEAGTMVVVGIYALHRDPALWENPLV